MIPDAEESGDRGESVPGFGLATSVAVAILADSAALLPLPSEKVVYWPVPALASPSAPG